MAGTGKRGGVLHVRKPRANEWTKAARGIFLRHLAATCNVQASCMAAGKTAGALYRLRARDAGFARDWALAMEQGYQRLEAALLHHAMGDRLAHAGLEQDPAEADGETASATDVGHEPRVFDPELALKLLAQWRGRDPQGRRQAVHLKQPSHAEVLKALDRKLTAMEKRLGSGA